MSEQASTAAPAKPGRLTARSTLAGLGLLLGGALVLITPQPWLVWNFDILPDAVSVTGMQAAAGVQAFALAVLAVSAALSLAGPIAGMVLSVVEFALAIGAVSSVWHAHDNALGVSIDRLAELTGVSGEQTWAAQGGTVSFTGWFWTALVAAALLGVHAIWVAVVARRWPKPSRRFQTRASEPLTSRSAIDAAESAQVWDAFSAGEDPTDQR
ncbi:Trp biosynthesis-associated membrane protein [Pseudoclavibacter soli]|uniref:Trp biosynthesis-associated membrane protein n=1 Tax=Pseudoclavibacter soli TaxID=452623 RepID=UPI00040148D0|nr:Trp biosynthesis-associated membrane protein [Pseudoclavibacter soli]